MSATQYYGVGRIGATTSVALTSTAAASVAAVSPLIQKIRVVTTQDSYIAIGKTANATTSQCFLPAGSPEVFTITQGENVSGLTTSTAAVMFVTEIM